MTANVVNANDAKIHFGEVLLKAQREPVHISKHGKPVAVLVAAEDFVSSEELKLELLRLRAERAREQIAAGDAVEGGAFFDTLLQESDN